MINFLSRVITPILRVLDFLTPIGDLLARTWVASIFFRAGLTKIASWDSTVALFSSVYNVPLLPPYFAAVIGTTAELILPILIVLGLGGRIIILLLFIYNIIAVISYDFLFTTEGSVGLNQHISWGFLLMLLMLHGPGKLSIDHWLDKKYGKQIKKEINKK